MQRRVGRAERARIRFAAAPINRSASLYPSAPDTIRSEVTRAAARDCAADMHDHRLR